MNCTIEYKDNAELCAKMTAVLLDFGYVVKRPEPTRRLSVGELAKLVGRSSSSVCRSLKRVQCPPFVAIHGKKRIIALEPNDALLTYLQNNTPGQRHDLAQL